MTDLYTPTAHVSHPQLRRYKQPFDPLTDYSIVKLSLGKIIDTNNVAHTCSVRLGNNIILRNVVFVTPYAGTRSGIYRVPKVDNALPDTNRDGSLDTLEPTYTADSWCLVGFAEGNMDQAFIVGSFFPQVNQIANDDIHAIDRDHLDNVELWTEDNNTAKYTNDLSGMVMGWDDNRDTPYDFDPGHGGSPNFDVGKTPWLIKQTHDFFVALIQHGKRLRAKLWTDGRISLQQGNETVIEIHATGEVSITSPTLVSINAPAVTINGNLFVNGNYSSPGTMKAEDIQSVTGAVPGQLNEQQGQAGVAGPTISHDVAKAWPPS